MTELRAPRLLLRSWRDQDLAAYAALNADPEVRRWFPGVLTRSESDDEAARLRLHEAEHGFTLWAAEVPGVAPFIGFVGLLVVRFPAPFTPAVEIGWRLARGHWGRGYATEAAGVGLAHALGPLGMPEIVAFTVPGNAASRRVMEKIGMVHDSADGLRPSRPARRTPDEAARALSHVTAGIAGCRRKPGSCCGAICACRCRRRDGPSASRWAAFDPVRHAGAVHSLLSEAYALADGVVDSLESWWAGLRDDAEYHPRARPPRGRGSVEAARHRGSVADPCFRGLPRARHRECRSQGRGGQYGGVPTLRLPGHAARSSQMTAA